jgi:hypothetical protein
MPQRYKWLVEKREVFLSPEWALLVFWGGCLTVWEAHLGQARRDAERFFGGRGWGGILQRGCGGCGGESSDLYAEIWGGELY